MTARGRRQPAISGEVRTRDVFAGIAKSPALGEYIHTSLKARESQGLPRHVEDQAVLQKILELLQPVDSADNKTGTTAA